MEIPSPSWERARVRVTPPTKPNTKSPKRSIDIYTDGSCIGNPGPGGWAAIIIENGATRELHGRDDHTTNNKMEILAAIKGIEATPSGADVRVHSDSSYLINTMTKNWKRNKNRDLWARLDSAVAKRTSGGTGSRATPDTRSTKWPTASPTPRQEEPVNSPPSAPQ